MSKSKEYKNYHEKKKPKRKDGTIDAGKGKRRPHHKDEIKGVKKSSRNDSGNNSNNSSSSNSSSNSNSNNNDNKSYLFLVQPFLQMEFLDLPSYP